MAGEPARDHARAANHPADGGNKERPCWLHLCNAYTCKPSCAAREQKKAAGSCVHGNWSDGRCNCVSQSFNIRPRTPSAAHSCTQRGCRGGRPPRSRLSPPAAPGRGPPLRWGLWVVKSVSVSKAGDRKNPNARTHRPKSSCLWPTPQYQHLPPKKQSISNHRLTNASVGLSLFAVQSLQRQVLR